MKTTHTSKTAAGKACTCALAVLVFVSLCAFMGCGRVSELLDESAMEDAYNGIIQREAQANGLEPALLKAVIWKESRFHADRIGGKGEVGLMQLLPAAVSDWSRATKQAAPTQSALFDPEVNVRIGAWYLGWCGRCFSERRKDDDVLRLAVYNAGYGRVKEKWLPKNSNEALTLDDITFPTTRSYIEQILERAAKYRAEQKL